MDKVKFDYELQQAGLTQKEYEEILKLITDKKNKVTDIDWSEIVDQYDLPYNVDTLRKANATIFGGSFVYQYLSEHLDSETKTDIKYNQSSTSVNKDGTISSRRLIELNEEDVKKPDCILKAHGFDPKEWKIVTVRNNIREAISKKQGAIALYASFLTVKPIDDSEISFARIEELFEKLDRNYSLPKLKCEVQQDGDKLLLIDIADLHLNLLTSLLTTGTVYNCQIAEKIFFDVLENIITRTQQYNFAKVIFCIGGDMLNSDNLKGTTTKGTPQDNDVSYYDSYELLTTMIIKAIDLLRKQYKCQVDVIYVMGNHDEVTGFKLAKFVDAWYRNEDSVKVDYSPLPRKYSVFGKTLFCFAHEAGRLNDLPALIADEAREVWSQVNHTEVLLQHFHNENVISEKSNMRIQILPTISPTSKWSNDKGYNSKRQCKTFIYDKEDGLTDVLYTTIK